MGKKINREMQEKSFKRKGEKGEKKERKKILVIISSVLQDKEGAI